MCLKRVRHMVWRNGESKKYKEIMIIMLKNKTKDVMISYTSSVINRRIFLRNSYYQKDYQAILKGNLTYDDH